MAIKVDEIIVRICAERILSRGLNPKTGKVYVLTDVTNEVYRQAIENYILKNTPEV